MKMYMMRHAQSPGMMEARVSRDFDRPISELGRECARMSGARIMRETDKPALVLVSPLVRAQLTAREVLSELKHAPELRVYEPLSNKMDGEDLYKNLEKDGLLDRVLLLVGHFPQIPDLTRHLTGQEVTFSTAEVCAFETSGRQARLLWSYSPSHD